MGPRSVLAVATPPIKAPMTPSIAASVPVKYKFLIGVLGVNQVFRNLSGVAGYP
jgi:hypothetical protein